MTAEVSRPGALVVTDNLLDRTRIEAALGAAGWRTVAEADGAVVIVDLEARGADAVISESAGIRVIAYGPHVDDIAMARARALGADQVLPRSRFFRDIGSLLPTIG